MTDPIKITSLEAENVKRVRAVQLHPSATGLTLSLPASWERV